ARNREPAGLLSANAVDTVVVLASIRLHDTKPNLSVVAHVREFRITLSVYSRLVCDDRRVANVGIVLGAVYFVGASGFSVPVKSDSVFLVCALHNLVAERRTLDFN